MILTKKCPICNGLPAIVSHDYTRCCRDDHEIRFFGKEKYDDILYITCNIYDIYAYTGYLSPFADLRGNEKLTRIFLTNSNDDAYQRKLLYQDFEYYKENTFTELLGIIERIRKLSVFS